MRSSIMGEAEAEMASTGVLKAAADVHSICWTAAGTAIIIIYCGRNRKSLQLHLSMKSDCPMAYHKLT